MFTINDYVTFTGFDNVQWKAQITSIENKDCELIYGIKLEDGRYKWAYEDQIEQN